MSSDVVTNSPAHRHNGVCFLDTKHRATRPLSRTNNQNFPPSEQSSFASISISLQGLLLADPKRFRYDFSFKFPEDVSLAGFSPSHDFFISVMSSSSRWVTAQETCDLISMGSGGGSIATVLKCT